jgi:hypothetical protein
MEIGNWKSTKELNGIYRQIRDLGLETHLAELEAFGFTVIEDALTPEQIEKSRDAILKVTSERWGHEIDIENEAEQAGVDYVPFLLDKDPIFPEIVMNEKPLALITYLMGEHVLLSSMGSHCKGPGGECLPLHSDQGNGMIREGMNSVSHSCNCNYALTDYTEEGGCLGMVPGSHRYFRQPTAQEIMLGGENGNPFAIPMEIPAGAAVIWHGNTWHGSYKRTIPGVRVNLAVYFCRQYIATQEDVRGNVSQELLDQFKDQPRFATLMGQDTTYGWGPDGPDMAKMRSNVAGRTWHS